MAGGNPNPNTKVATLGEHTYPVVSQKHARLRHHIGPEDFQKVLSAEYSHEAYRLLCILIPAMDPGNKKATDPMHEWEFDGFRSKEDWELYHKGNHDVYDEDDDPSPTPDEIAGAFQTALTVNGAGRLGKIFQLVNAASTVVTQTQPSDDSPGENGDTATMTTGTSPQTQKSPEA